VRTQAHKLQQLSVWFSIDQHQIRLDVAIPVVFPIARERMVTVTWLQRQIDHQRRQDGCEISVERGAVLALFFTLVIALELAKMLNRPH